jgi:hypothetical protein
MTKIPTPSDVTSSNRQLLGLPKLAARLGLSEDDTVEYASRLHETYKSAVTKVAIRHPQNTADSGDHLPALLEGEAAVLWTCLMSRDFEPLASLKPRG